MTNHDDFPCPDYIPGATAIRHMSSKETAALLKEAGITPVECQCPWCGAPEQTETYCIKCGGHLTDA